MKIKKNNINETPDSYSGLLDGFVAEMVSEVSIFGDIEQGNLSKERFSKKYNFLERATLDDIKNKSNFTPLMWAIYHNKKDYVKVLIDLGADINQIINIQLAYRGFNGKKSVSIPSSSINESNWIKYEGQHTPLILAIQCGYNGIFNLLLENNPDIHQLVYNEGGVHMPFSVEEESYGINAFSYAVIFERVEMVQNLIRHCQTSEEKKRMLNQKTDDFFAYSMLDDAIFSGGYPLFYAIRSSGDFEVLKVLLANQVDTSISISLGEDPITNLFSSFDSSVINEVNIKCYAALNSRFLQIMKIIEPYVSVLNDQEDDMDMLFQLRRHNFDKIRKIKDTHFTVYEHVSYHQDAYDWILQNSVAYYNFSDQFNIEYRHHTYPGHLVHAILANHMNQLHQSVHVPFGNLDLLPILFDDEILNKVMFSPLRLSIIEDNEKGIAFSLRNQFKSFEPEVLRSIFKASQEYSQDKFGRTEFKYSGLLDRYIDQHRQFDASNEHLIKACVLSLLGIESLDQYQAYVDYSMYPQCGEDFIYHFPVPDSDRNHALSVPSAPVDFSTFIFDFSDSSDDEESVNVQSSQAMPMVRPEHVLIPYVLMLQKRAILEQISHHISLNEPSYVNPFLCRIHTLTHQILKQEETLEDKQNTNAMLELVSDFPWLFSESEILNNKHIFDTYMKQLDANYLNETTVTKYIVYLMKKEHAIFLYDVEKQYLIARMLDCQPKHSLWDEFPGIQSGRNNFTTAMSNINHDISIDVLPKIVSYYGSSISFFTSEADVHAKEPVFDLLKIPVALRDDLIDLTRVMIKNCILNDFKQGYCALKTKYSITSEMNDMIIKYAEYYQRDDILKYLQKSKDSEKDCATSQSYDHYLEHASNKRLRG